MSEPYTDEELLSWLDRQRDAACGHYAIMAKRFRGLRDAAAAAEKDARYLAGLASKLDGAGVHLIESAGDAAIGAVQRELRTLLGNPDEIEAVVNRWPSKPSNASPVDEEPSDV